MENLNGFLIFVITCAGILIPVYLIDAHKSELETQSLICELEKEQKEIEYRDEISKECNKCKEIVQTRCDSKVEGLRKISIRSQEMLRDSFRLVLAIKDQKHEKDLNELGEGYQAKIDSVSDASCSLCYHMGREIEAETSKKIILKEVSDARKFILDSLAVNSGNENFIAKMGAPLSAIGESLKLEKKVCIPLGFIIFIFLIALFMGYILSLKFHYRRRIRKY